MKIGNSKLELSGKTALVTGSAKRLGSAIAFALADCGADVIVHYSTSEEEALKTVDTIKKLGVNAWAVRADLSDPNQPYNLIDSVFELTGKLDVLINNASIFSPDKLLDFSFDRLIENIKINAWAPLALSRQFVKHQSKGHIINLLDTKVSHYDLAHSSYFASKNMLKLFTEMLALELAPNFQVNAVAPGLTLAPEGKDRTYLESMKNTVPLKKAGKVKDITDAVLFLLSSDI
ncbi:MAG: SDR family NAD(P)-dependent oxidoreductase [Armatimonadota bacterium]